MKFLLNLVLVCLFFSCLPALAQQKKPDDTTRSTSVVVRKHKTQDSISQPLVKPRKWRPRVVVVPATSPGGRSRQEIKYSDSLGRVKP